MWVKVKAGQNNLLICTCYRPPDVHADFWALLQDSLDLARHSGITDIFLGVCHAKLRMLCSPLKDHLFSHIHVIDNPTSACGYSRENNKHFLLDCPLFANERTVMLTELADLNFRPVTKNLLFGNKDYSEETNSKAFKIVQSFIMLTGRFDWHQVNFQNMWHLLLLQNWETWDGWW